MEARLTEAARTGSVADLLDLLQQDPLLLDKIIVLCVSETPLHVAALLGHAEFAAELLTRRPELAAELDSDGNSPLHLAAAKGRPDVAELLLKACPEAGKVKNLDGRTPLHVAAAKGRVEVVSQLVRNKGELTRSLTDRGETAMHLCVRNGKLDALRVIIEEIGKDKELVNWSDTDGNSVLHIAVAKKNLEVRNQ